MTSRRVSITPFTDQQPGTSGLRKTTREFRQPNYLEAFIQAILGVLDAEGPLVLGGDGRFFNDEALQIILRMAAANGRTRVIVARDGLLSTPAASQLVRQRQAAGAIILSASHNPGGPQGDFGVKFNGANGAPAPEEATSRAAAISRELTSYLTLDAPDLDLSSTGEQILGGMTVEVVDAASAYADLMAELFDFPAIARMLRTPGRGLVFDAMSAVTGPYAIEIFEGRLGAAAGTVMRGRPLPDFGGGHPDPDPVNAAELMAIMNGPDAPALGAASDGDGDRHLIAGPGFTVSPSDSLAVLLDNAELIPGYRGRVTGVARSMPTSRAVDKVAEALGVPCFETPTGWKYFGSLLDAGRITLCGEESAGAGSDHVREKDGVWAVLFWLNIMAARDMSVEAIVRDHWARYGRQAYGRLDFEGLDSEAANALVDDLRGRLPSLAGARAGGRMIEHADDFSYVDPINGASAAGQGVRLQIEGGGRIVMRLSGTGTKGATLRVYLEQAVTDPDRFADTAAALIAPLEPVAGEVGGFQRFLGTDTPTHRV